MPIKPRKSRQKSRAAKSTRPGRNGGRLNSGGTFAGAGRPPDEFKQKMAAIASSDEALAYLDECVKGEHGPQVAIAAHKYSADRGYGQPTQEVEVTERRWVAEYPEPVKDTEEWIERYGPMLHRGGSSPAP